MPITTFIDSSRGLKCHVVTGTVRLEESHETLQGVITHPGPEPEMDELWDLRDLGPGDPILGVEELNEMIRRYGLEWARTTNARAAIVVSRTVDYGMARMGMALMEPDAPNRVAVFRSLHAAQRWLEDGGRPRDLWGSESSTAYFKPDASRSA